MSKEKKNLYCTTASQTLMQGACTYFLAIISV